MMKLFIRFCLALGIFLLGVHSKLYVHAYRHLIGSTPAGTPWHAAFGAAHHQEAFFISPDGAGRRKESPKKVYAADNGDQDDKLSTFKLFLEINNHFSDGCYAHPPGYFCSYIKQCLSFCQLITDFPPHIYLVLGVIRR